MPFTANAWRLLALGKSRLKSASRCEIPAARYVVDDDNSDSLGVACEGELKASAMIQHAKMLVQNAYLRCVCMTKCAPDRQKKAKKRQKKSLVHMAQGLYRGGRTRTLGPRLWRPLLYQLSYAPIDSPPIGRNRQKIKQKRHIDRFSSCAKVRIFATTSICLYKSHQKSPQWRMGSWTICAQGMCAKVATLAA